MKHTLVVIGWTGLKRCYLDVNVAEAKRRYVERIGELPDDEHVDAFEFEDEFAAYDVWADAKVV